MLHGSSTLQHLSGGSHSLCRPCSALLCLANAARDMARAPDGSIRHISGSRSRRGGRRARKQVKTGVFLAKSRIFRCVRLAFRCRSDAHRTHKLLTIPVSQTRRLNSYPELRYLRLKLRETGLLTEFRASYGFVRRFRLRPVNFRRRSCFGHLRATETYALVPVWCL